MSRHISARVNDELFDVCEKYRDDWGRPLNWQINAALYMFHESRVSPDAAQRIGRKIVEGEDEGDA